MLSSSSAKRHDDHLTIANFHLIACYLDNPDDIFSLARVNRDALEACDSDLVWSILLFDIFDELLPPLPKDATEDEKAKEATRRQLFREFVNKDRLVRFGFYLDSGDSSSAAKKSINNNNSQNQNDDSLFNEDEDDDEESEFENENEDVDDEYYHLPEQLQKLVDSKEPSSIPYNWKLNVRLQHEAHQSKRRNGFNIQPAAPATNPSRQQHHRHGRNFLQNQGPATTTRTPRANQKKKEQPKEKPRIAPIFTESCISWRRDSRLSRVIDQHDSPTSKKYYAFFEDELFPSVIFDCRAFREFRMRMILAGVLGREFFFSSSSSGMMDIIDRPIHTQDYLLNFRNSQDTTFFSEITLRGRRSEGANRLIHSYGLNHLIVDPDQAIDGEEEQFKQAIQHQQFSKTQWPSPASVSQIRSRTRTNATTTSNSVAPETSSITFTDTCKELEAIHQRVTARTQKTRLMRSYINRTLHYVEKIRSADDVLFSAGDFANYCQNWKALAGATFGFGIVSSIAAIQFNSWYPHFFFKGFTVPWFGWKVPSLVSWFFLKSNDDESIEKLYFRNEAMVQNNLHADGFLDVWSNFPMPATMAALQNSTLSTTTSIESHQSPLSLSSFLFSNSKILPASIATLSTWISETLSTEDSSSFSIVVGCCVFIVFFSSAFFGRFPRIHRVDEKFRSLYFRHKILVDVFKSIHSRLDDFASVFIVQNIRYLWILLPILWSQLTLRNRVTNWAFSIGEWALWKCFWIVSPVFEFISTKIISVRLLPSFCTNINITISNLFSEHQQPVAFLSGASSSLSLYSVCFLVSGCIAVYRAIEDHQEYNQFVSRIYDLPFTQRISARKIRRLRVNPFDRFDVLNKYHPRTRKYYPSRFFHVGCNVAFNVGLLFLRWKLYEAFVIVDDSVLPETLQKYSNSYYLNRAFHFGIVVGCEFAVRASCSLVEYFVSKIIM